MVRSLARFALSLVLVLAFVAVGASKPALAAGPAWWNASFTDRLAINVRANDAITSGYTLDVIFNHARMVSQGVSLASGNDVRIAYFDGSAWTELDRVLGYGSSWNSATTDLAFKTVAAVSANTDDVGYYLYYGNGAAASPPANANNVYALWDDFTSGSVDSSKWAVTGANTPTVSQSGGTLTVSSSSAAGSYPSYSFLSNTSFGPGYRTSFRNVTLSASTSYNFDLSTGSDIAFQQGNYAYYSGGWKPVGTGAPLTTPWGPLAIGIRQDAVGKTTIAINGTDTAVRNTGTSTKAAGISYQANTPSAGSTFSFSLTGIDIRKFVANEPKVSIEGGGDFAFIASVAPLFSFTVATHNPAVACNGIMQSANATTTGTAVALGRLNVTTPAIGIQDLSVTSNANNGFVVGTKTSGPMTAGSNTVADVANTNAAPAAFPTGAGFGYTTDALPRFASKWAGFTTTSSEVLSGVAPLTSSGCVAYKLQVASTTPAASYATNVIYTAVPTF